MMDPVIAPKSDHGLKSLLWVNDSGEMLGGCEHYIRNTACLLKECGVKNFLLYGGHSAALSQTMLEAFDGAFPIADPVRQVNEISPSLVYIHRLHGETPTRAFARSGRPVMRFYHDHRLFCLRQHKYKPITYRLCKKPVGLRCYPCMGFVKRNNANQLKFISVGSLRREVKANLEFQLHLVGSKYMADQLIQNQFPPDKVRILPLYSIPPNDSAPVARDPCLILYTGQLTWGKGLDLLLEALVLLPQNVRLIVAGTGRQESLFRSCCQSLCLTDRVKFAGKVPPDQLADYYRQALCVVAPGRQPETFGLVGLEAMSHGTPVIATGIGGVVEWLQDGNTGLAVPPGDVRQLALAIASLVEDPQKAEDLGRNGRRRYIDLFQPKRHVDDLLDVCKSLL